MEAWIEDTLHEAEQLEIPGVIIKPKHKNPITRYGVDRLTLAKGGISDETIDRVYRSLFVYSVGFHELMKTCLKHTNNRFELITSIWKVFSILLEFCCKSDYKILVGELTIQNEQKLKQMEEEFKYKIDEMKEDELSLKSEMNVMHNYSTLLEREKLDEKNTRMKLEEELLQNSKNHEEEVQLRLKFESKLNNMHSIHRDLGTKYRRALLDIETLQNTNELLNSKKLEIFEELNLLKTDHAEQTTKITYDREKITALEKEKRIKSEQVSDLLNKTSEMQEKFDKLQYKHQLSLKTISEQKLNIDVYQSQILTLKNEKTHLRQREVEARMLKETFENKLRETSEELKETVQTLQHSQRQVLGFNEIKKEREERIDKLKTEFESLSVTHKKTDAKLSKTTIELEKTSDQLQSISSEYHNTVEKLKRINKARNDKESRLSEEKNLTYRLKKEVKELTSTIREKMRLIEQDKTTIGQRDKDIRRINIDQTSLEKRTALQINQLNEKIVNISGLLHEEEQSRKSWSEKYEREQRMHSEANTELLKVKSQNKDFELSIKDLEIRFDNITKTTEHLQKTCEKMQEKANQFMNKYENANRELMTKKQMLKQVEKQKEEIIQARQQDLDKLKNEMQIAIFEQEMHYEDLLSRVNHLQVTYDQMRVENERLLVKDTVYQTKIEQIEQTKKDEEIKTTKALTQVQENKQKSKDLEDQLKKLQTLLETVRRQKETLEQCNTRLNVDLKLKDDDAKKLFHQIKKLENQSKSGSKFSTPQPDYKTEKNRSPELDNTNAIIEEEKEGASGEGDTSEAKQEHDTQEGNQLPEGHHRDEAQVDHQPNGDSNQDINNDIGNNSISERLNDEEHDIDLKNSAELQNQDSEQDNLKGEDDHELVKQSQKYQEKQISNKSIVNEQEPQPDLFMVSKKEISTRKKTLDKVTDNSQTKIKQNKRKISENTIMPHKNLTNPLNSESRNIEGPSNQGTQKKTAKSIKSSKNLKPVMKNQEVQVNLRTNQNELLGGQHQQESENKAFIKPVQNIPEGHIECREDSTMTDFELIQPIIDQNVQYIIQQKFKTHSPMHPQVSENSLHTDTQDRSDGIESINQKLHHDESQNTYNLNYIPQKDKNSYLRHHINETRASEHLEDSNNSPMLTKNTIHHMSNHSTIMPNSIKHDLSMIEAHQKLMQQTPIRVNQTTNSVEYSDEMPNTHRSDDLMNTSTDLEPSSRYSSHLVAQNQSPLSAGRVYKKNMRQVSQQPGYIDQEDMIMEMPNGEEILSNPKSREQSNQNNRRHFEASKSDAFSFLANETDESLMMSRYKPYKEQKLDTFDTIDNSITQEPSITPGISLHSSLANVKQIKIKVKKDMKPKDASVKVKGKTSIRTMIKAAKSRD